MIKESLAAGAITSLESCPPLCLSHITDLALSMECVYKPQTKGTSVIHVRSSHDGLNFDTSNIYTFNMPIKPGQTVRKTFEMKPKVMYLKVQIENTDPSVKITNLQLYATLGG